MAEINITPAPAGLPSLPPEFLRQMENATSQPLEIMQRGQSTRLNILAESLRDARELVQEKERAKENVKNQQMHSDAQMRERAALLGIEVKATDTAETLSTKIHELNKTAAKATVDLYKGQLKSIQSNKERLLKEIPNVINKSASPEQQRIALTKVLTTANMPNDVKVKLLKVLRSAEGGSQVSITNAVNEATKTIQDRGTWGWGKVVPGYYGSYKAGLDAASELLQTYNTEVQTLVGPSRQLDTAVLMNQLQDLNKQQQDIGLKFESNAWPLIRGLGKEAEVFMKDWNQSFGGEINEAENPNKVMERAGVAAPVAAAANQPPLATNLSPSIPTPSAPDVLKNWKPSSPSADRGVESGFGTNLTRPKPLDGGWPSGGGMAFPPGTNDADVQQSQSSASPAKAADAAMVMTLFKSNPIAAQAPHDRLISNSEEDAKLFKAVMDKNDPTGQRGGMFQKMITGGNEHEKIVGTKLFNAVVMMVRSGIDPAAIMAPVASSGRASVPPVGNAEVGAMPSMFPELSGQ